MATIVYKSQCCLTMMHGKLAVRLLFAASLLIITGLSRTTLAAPIQHDAEHYILLAQNDDRWQADDKIVDAKLAEIRKRNGGKRPNLIYILLDDLGFGSLGSRKMNYVNGYSTPNINAIARNGVSFMRMVRIADCTGIPSDERWETVSEDIREELDLQRFPSAVHTPWVDGNDST